MSREVHVRFCESVGARFPCATLLEAKYGNDQAKVRVVIRIRLIEISMAVQAE